MEAYLLRTIAILLCALSIAGLATADHACQDASPEVDTGDTPLGRYYVDNDPCQPDCLFSIWIYQESNGENGLQRGDEVCSDEDWCCNDTSDTIIF